MRPLRMMGFLQVKGTPDALSSRAMSAKRPDLSNNHVAPTGCGGKSLLPRSWALVVKAGVRSW
jgi:hypothetical protein